MEKLKGNLDLGGYRDCCGVRKVVERPPIGNGWKSNITILFDSPYFDQEGHFQDPIQIISQAQGSIYHEKFLNCPIQKAVKFRYNFNTLCILLKYANDVLYLPGLPFSPFVVHLFIWLYLSKLSKCTPWQWLVLYSLASTNFIYISVCRTWGN